MHIPFKHKAKVFLAFWSMTVPIMVLVLPLVVLGILNPFWFREAALLALQNFVERIAHTRNKILKPLTTKYDLFDVIKNTTQQSSSAVQGAPSQSP